MELWGYSLLTLDLINGVVNRVGKTLVVQRIFNFVPDVLVNPRPIFIQPRQNVTLLLSLFPQKVERDWL